jgi:hypothetical protein
MAAIRKRKRAVLWERAGQAGSVMVTPGRLLQAQFDA